MSWASWDAFWSMGGKGAYVWSAYGALALAIAVEVAGVRARLARARRIRAALRAARLR